MTLLCYGGPLDGANFDLTGDEAKTNRKPDGLWFNTRDEHGRRAQEEYRFVRNIVRGETIYICYEHHGQLVDVHDPGVIYSNPEDLEHDERPGIINGK